MKEKDQGKIAKLQDKIRVLEKENQRLTEHAEDIVLLSRISEHLLEMSDRDKMINYILEEISLLKIIPYTALGSLLEVKMAPVKYQYASFAQGDNILSEIVMDESIRKKLFEDESIVKLKLNEKIIHSVFPGFSAFGFKPVYLIMMGVKLFSSLDFFIFADDKPDAEERMDFFASTFAPVSSLIAARFENLRMADQLKFQNNWLVQEINNKTAKLREKVDYQSQIIDNSLDGIILHKNNLIEYANPAALRILEAEDLSVLEGHSIYEFVEIDTEEKKAIKNRVEQVVEDKKVTSFRETKVITAKGNHRTVEVGGIPFIDGQDTLVHLTLHDVTEKKKMERELEDERDLFMGGPTVVFKWIDGEEWPVRYVSPNVFEQFGYIAKEMINGKINYDSLIHPDDRNRIEGEISQFKSKGIYQYEQQYRLRHADGSYRQVMDFTIFHPVTNGNSYYHGYVIDITKQIKAEKALSLSESRYRAMVEYSFAGIGLINDQYIFTYANQNLCLILDYPHEEVVGADFRKFLTKESLDIVSDRYRRRQAGEDVPSRYGFTIKQKNGSVRFVEMSSSVIYDEENRKSSLMQMIDITDQKLAEREIEQAHEILEQNYQSLQAVQNITEAVRLPADLDRLARRTIEALSRYSGAPSVGFFVMSDTGKQLELVDASGFSRNLLLKVKTIPLDESLSGMAVKQKEVVVSNNLSHENRVLPHALELFSEAGYQATVSIPLLYQDEVLGVVNLLFDRKLELGKKARKTFQTIGKTLGLALANVNHLVELEKEIVQRIQSEDYLRKSEERFRGIFDNSLDAISLTTLEGKYIDVNQGFLTVTGYSRDEVIGKTAGDINIWEDIGQRQHVIDSLSKKKTLNNFPARFRMKDGRIAETLLSVQYLDLMGNPYLLMTTRDITEQVRMQKSLKENEEKFRLTFNHASDAMFLLEADGDNPPIIRDLNETACKLHQYSRKELIGQPMSLLIVKSEEIDIKENTQKIMSGESILFESRHRKKDGHTFPIEISAQKVNIGEVDYILSIDRDISERKKTEAELRRYREGLEKLVKERTAELEQVNKSLQLKNKELIRYNDLFINREFRIKELREEVRKLKKRLGEAGW